jgi:hypothetical protein
MQSELAQYRNMQPNDDMPSKTLLYSYSKYKKEREEAAAAARAQKPPRGSRHA